MKKLLLLLLMVTGMVNAQIVNIPDPVFKAKLLAASPSNRIASTDEYPTYSPTSPPSFVKIDANNDGEIQVSEALLIKILWLDRVDSQLITNMEGIEAFVNLRYLYLSNNQIASLDVSNNVNLTYIDLFNNRLTSLDVSNNVNLYYLNCNYNQLTSLVIGDIHLQVLHCQRNQLTSLPDIDHLMELNCQYNQLTTLDLTRNRDILAVYCNNNQLITLFVKNGKDDEYLQFSNNPNLTYICADAAQVSSVQAQAGSGVIVDSNCVLGLNENHFENTITVYPNPSRSTVAVSSNSVVKSIQITDYMGRVVNVKSVNDLQIQIDVSGFANGVYFFKIETENGTKIEKIIKE
ncbi:T9SS type A sorting domain-containing protein [Flavobacterium sp. SM15]|uniref:leucine-rich repeat domain-containing protein n=1 Tax=Flavobacterium sp. SM15 TaxID=2908005 RepID=UPI001EDBA167|nr:T9SS type A sorting domain-containing protein [Flavobacterium sp. SM15]MCG2611314.1 T9SS type A sorting domain-containing protein [Flavobacterium sp. SM15]